MTWGWVGSNHQPSVQYSLTLTCRAIAVVSKVGVLILELNRPKCARKNIMKN